MRTAKRILITMLIASLASTATASTQQSKSKSGKKNIGPLAVINGEPLTVDELREGFVKRHGGHEKFLGGEQELRRFIEIIVDERLLVQEAYNLGIQNQSDVRSATEEYADQTSLDYLVQSETEGKANPTEEQVHAAWEANTKRLYLVQEIVVDSRDEAEQVRAMILGGANFEEIARSCSTAPSKMYGGRLGNVGWGTMEPAWETVVFPLEPGEVSPAFRTKGGWNVVQLLDLTTIVQPDYNSVRAKIEGILKRRMLDERRASFSNELWMRYHVAVAPVDHSAASLSSLHERAPETALAAWDGGSLLLKDFPSEGELKMMAALPSSRAQQFFDDQLRTAVNEQLVRLEVKRRNIAALPEVADPVRRFQEDLMERVLYADHILKDLEVSDDDVKAYFEKHRSDLKKPERRHVAHIVVASEAAARTIRAKAVAGESWRDLVEKNSLDTQSIKDAGDLGWVTKRDTPREFASVLSLQEGAVSEPIQSKFGWHLIKILKIEDERPLAFEDCKDDVRKLVTEQKKREKRDYWVKKLRAASTVTISTKAIRDYVKDNPFEEAKATPKSH